MVEAIRDSEFSKLQSVGHAFFTRKGGVSNGHYDSLNCSDFSADDPENIKENKRRVLEHLDFPLESMITVTMTHGINVAIVGESWDTNMRPLADAMVTKQKNLVLASESADCPIILFADEQAEIIGLAHAGWKGAKAGIIEKTIETMIMLGAKPNNICSVIGPCISKNSYEVSHEFHQQLLLDSDHNHRYFTQSTEQNGHLMFDLTEFVRNKLDQLALRSITAIGLDTYMNEELFFSRRRSYHRGESEFGGHLSCIYFNHASIIFQYTN